jgi:hypothetical protein
VVYGVGFVYLGMELTEIICEKTSLMPLHQFPFLTATVSDFDIDIVDSKTNVIGVVDGEKYLCFVTCASFSRDLWELEILALEQINT